MTEISNKQINKIGDRIKSFSENEKDLITLINFRDTYFKSLFELSSLIKKEIKFENLSFLLSGRLKRKKSIIRKLRRIENKNMDLTRIADLGGLRIIVKDRKDQDMILSEISKRFEISKQFDYRDQNQNYKSIHIHIKHEDSKNIEVQIRTIPQHTWADESESFGEQVKENSGDKNALEYLSILSKDIHNLEKGNHVNENDNFIYKSRNPLGDKLLYLKQNFEIAIKSEDFQDQDKIYLIVFDSFTRNLNHSDEFDISEANEVFTEYKRLSLFLDDIRFEHLIMNSDSQNSLKITHPRFFFKN